MAAAVYFDLDQFVYTKAIHKLLMKEFGSMTILMKKYVVHANEILEPYQTILRDLMRRFYARRKVRKRIRWTFVLTLKL